ncbi:HotDog domain-containing protein [Dunaliella salina]|uniref:HotDog domain-containing protein n=1 Tax=Dunaliella salina TaxID=3046 RepID=A0ABQ7GJ07_DUNSA|nr:HotDog domain-containing protein [Dunaliella salina]|eukprot:KAF5834569.1 HotDog domain-containing protein [Dunaliella salina]
MLRQHFLGRLVVEQDHLLATMIESGQLISLRCFYDKAARKFYSVAKMGKDVAGYPGLVHGGLTAALLDETFGGLSVNVWKSGGFGVAPGYTARLEVDYKQKVPTGSTVVYSAELESIEGRKMWMRAQVTDGKSTVYAAGRALFVSPKVPTMVSRVMSGVNQGSSFITGLVPGMNRNSNKSPTQ